MQSWSSHGVCLHAQSNLITGNNPVMEIIWFNLFTCVSVIQYQRKTCLHDLVNSGMQNSNNLFSKHSILLTRTYFSYLLNHIHLYIYTRVCICEIRKNPEWTVCMHWIKLHLHSSVQRWFHDTRSLLCLGLWHQNQSIFLSYWFLWLEGMWEHSSVLACNLSTAVNDSFCARGQVHSNADVKAAAERCLLTQGLGSKWILSPRLGH